MASRNVRETTCKDYFKAMKGHTARAHRAFDENEIDLGLAELNSAVESKDNYRQAEDQLVDESGGQQLLEAAWLPRADLLGSNRTVP